VSARSQFFAVVAQWVTQSLDIYHKSARKRAPTLRRPTTNVGDEPAAIELKDLPIILVH